MTNIRNTTKPDSMAPFQMSPDPDPTTLPLAAAAGFPWPYTAATLERLPLNALLYLALFGPLRQHGTAL